MEGNSDTRVIVGESGPFVEESPEDDLFYYFEERVAELNRIVARQDARIQTLLYERRLIREALS